MRSSSQYRLSSRPPFVRRANIVQRFGRRLLIGTGIAAGTAVSYRLFRRSQQSPASANRLLQLGRTSFEKAKQVAPASPKVQKAIDMTIGQAGAAEKVLGRSLVSAGNGSARNN